MLILIYVFILYVNMFAQHIPAKYMCIYISINEYVCGEYMFAYLLIAILAYMW